MTELKKIKIAIVDDSKLSLLGWQESFKTCQDIEIIGTALNKEAFRKLCDTNKNKLDVLVMDKNIDGKTQFDDFSFIEEIRESYPDKKIIVYTWDYFIDHIDYLRQIKINAYIPSKLATELMPEAIRSVTKGIPYFPRNINTESADKSEYDRGKEFDIEFIKMANSLSPGQNKVACLLARDMLNPQIANILNISVKAVENHVSKIYGKLLIFPDEEQARSKFNHHFGEYFRGR